MLVVCLLVDHLIGWFIGCLFGTLIHRLFIVVKSLSCCVLGVMLISLALCADAVIGNVQEKVIKSYQSTSTEVVSINMTYITFIK